MTLAFALLSAYVLGSFPSAYLAGRIFKGIDLRTAGSGNLGATNVYREVGAAAAAAVLAVDGLKGWLAVAGVPRWLSLDVSPWWIIGLGAAAIAGHAKPVFLLWRGGGKGVATGAGVFLALVPEAVGVAAGVFVVVVVLTRYVSVGSVLATLALTVAVAAMRGVSSPQFIASALILAFIVWAHRANLHRLYLGQEVRLGLPGGAR